MHLLLRNSPFPLVVGAQALDSFLPNADTGLASVVSGRLTHVKGAVLGMAREFLVVRKKIWL